MAQPPYKIMILLKRRPGMSVEQFRDYYEARHAKLCEKYMAGVTRYARRYLNPMPGTGEIEFDVVTETWFEDRAVYEAVLAGAASGILPQDVIEDEEKLFDRSKSRFVTVEERETDCSAPAFQFRS